MSQENVELIEGVFAGTEIEDKRVLLAALPELLAQTCDPDIERVEDPSAPTAASITGMRVCNSPLSDGLSSGTSTGARSSSSSTATTTCLSSLMSVGGEGLVGRA